MSTFTAPSISINSLSDLKSVKEYLRDLTKKVRFLSLNVDEDNFDPEAYAYFYKNEEDALKLSYDLEKFKIELKNYSDDVSAKLSVTSQEIDLLVSKGDVTSEVNLSSEGIHFSSGQLVVNSDNFVLDGNGNLMMKGTINATSGAFGNFRAASDGGGPYVYNVDGKITAAHLSGTNIDVMGTLDMVTDTYINGCSIDMSNCKVATSRSTYLGWFYSDNVDVNSDVYGNCAYAPGEVYVESTIRCYDVFSTDEWIAWSDRRLKHNIVRIDEKEALAFLVKLRPVSYELKEGNDGCPHYGLIAQEVLETGDPFHIVSEHGGLYSINYRSLDAVIAAALKYQKKELEELNVSL